MGTALEAAIPFAAGHELIRQRRRDLTLIGPISDMLFDQLVGAGCVRRIIAAWVGNVSAGLGHNYRRAVEKGMPAPIEVEDHSNLTLAFALQAARSACPTCPRDRCSAPVSPRRTRRSRRAPIPGRARPCYSCPLAPDVAVARAARGRGGARAFLGHARRDAPGRVGGEPGIIVAAVQPRNAS